MSTSAADRICRYVPVRLDCVNDHDSETWESEPLPSFSRVLDLNVTRYVADAFLLSLYAVGESEEAVIFENVHAGFFYPPYRDRFPVFDMQGSLKLRMSVKNIAACSYSFDAVLRWVETRRGWPVIAGQRLVSFVEDGQ